MCDNRDRPRARGWYHRPTDGVEIAQDRAYPLLCCFGVGKRTSRSRILFLCVGADRLAHAERVHRVERRARDSVRGSSRGGVQVAQHASSVQSPHNRAHREPGKPRADSGAHRSDPMPRRCRGTRTPRLQHLLAASANVAHAHYLTRNSGRRPTRVPLSVRSRCAAQEGGPRIAARVASACG